MALKDDSSNAWWSRTGTQLLIACTLIIGGLVSWYLGMCAGFGGKTGIGFVDWIVGDGEVIFNAAFPITGVGIVWMLVAVVRWLVKKKQKYK